MPDQRKRRNGSRKGTRITIRIQGMALPPAQQLLRDPDAVSNRRSDIARGHSRANRSAHCHANSAAHCGSDPGSDPGSDYGSDNDAGRLTQTDKTSCDSSSLYRR